MDKREVVKTIGFHTVNKVSLSKIPSSDWVKYLVIPEWHGKIIDKNIVTGDFGKQFGELTEEYVNAYIFDKKEPPTEIAEAIMNMADDVMSGREPILRAGDYISIQNYIKNSQIKKKEI
jgi:hypothetical protein